MAEVGKKRTYKRNLDRESVDMVNQGVCHMCENTGKVSYHIKAYRRGEYLPIIASENNSYYFGGYPSYGGAQVWWSNQTFRESTGNDYGCGVIAAANLVIYLSQHIKGFRALMSKELALSQNNLSESKALSVYDYLSIADELWRDISPYSGISKYRYTYGGDPYGKALPFGFGVSVRKLIGGLRRYSHKRGVELEFDVIKACRTKEEDGVAFIKESLIRNCPVLLMSLKNRLNKYEFHWVTITQLTKSEDGLRNQLTLSTWGECREFVDFSKLWGCGFFLENQYMIRLKK